MDKILALGLLVLLAPVLLIIMGLVYLDQKSIFFIQKRPGLLEQPFDLLKFKTMKDGSENDETRVTKLGQLLRKYSLDELPQLWNVLKGQMSLIGPRPYLMEYLELYADKHKKRHWVLPGMTGWAQVHGANELSWEKKLDLDAYYADEMSVWLDLKILIKTISILVNGKRKHLPDTKFAGYQENAS